MKRGNRHVFPGDGWGPIEVRSTSPQMRVLLQALTNGGLYGHTLEHTAEIILTEKLREMLLDDHSLLHRSSR